MENNSVYYLPTVMKSKMCWFITVDFKSCSIKQNQPFVVLEPVSIHLSRFMEHIKDLHGQDYQSPFQSQTSLVVFSTVYVFELFNFRDKDRNIYSKSKEQLYQSLDNTGTIDGWLATELITFRTFWISNVDKLQLDIDNQ